MATKDTLNDMKEFGLDRRDIDQDGLITLYHGGISLPEKLNKDETFFMTPHYDEAKDYARIRGGRVFTLKVNPDFVSFNQGSYEVEYTLGGKINDGVIHPEQMPLSEHTPKDNKVTYGGYAIGDTLSKTGYTILDIVIHKPDSAQFFLNTEKGDMWYDANTVINYEKRPIEPAAQYNSPGK